MSCAAATVRDLEHSDSQTQSRVMDARRMRSQCSVGSELQLGRWDVLETVVVVVAQPCECT